MSVYGAMITAISGLNAQTAKIGHISDNIANVNTVGYKKIGTNFSSLVNQSSISRHSPGGVRATPQFNVSVEGPIESSEVGTNLAISGNGFFAVTNFSDLDAAAAGLNTQTFYTRKGDFRVDADGNLTNSSGYYLQGQRYATDGQTIASQVMTTVNVGNLSGSVQPTTSAVVGLNLPSDATPITTGNPTSVAGFPTLVAGDISVAQVDTVSTVPLATGETATFTIGGTTVTYTAAGLETAQQARDGLLAAINANATLNTIVVATNGSNPNQLLVTALAAGTPFTATAGGTTTGEMSSIATTTANVAAVAQVDTVTLNAITTGQTATFTIGGTTVTIDDNGGAGRTATQVRDAMVAAINANPTLAAILTAANGGAANELTVTSDTAGTPFTASVGGASGPAIANTTPNGLPTAQVDTASFDYMAPSQTVEVTIGGFRASYTAGPTGATPQQARDGLVAAINASTGLSGIVTAAAGVNPEDLTLTANSAGTAFSATIDSTTASSSLQNTIANTSGFEPTNDGTQTGDLLIGYYGQTRGSPYFTEQVYYDDLGQAHTVRLEWFKDDTDASKWVARAFRINDDGGIDANSAQYMDVFFAQNGASAGTLDPTRYASGGTLAPGTGGFAGLDAEGSVNYNFSLLLPDGTSQTIALNLGKPGEPVGITQFASEFAVSTLQQDGLPYGQFEGVQIDELGDVYAKYGNGASRRIFQVPVITFSNPDGLQSIDGGAYRTSPFSGEPIITSAGVGAAGVFVPEALEGSNVDLATEFTQMIQAQRAYSANSRVITTSDEMLEELINLKR